MIIRLKCIHEHYTWILLFVMQEIYMYTHTFMKSMAFQRRETLPGVGRNQGQNPSKIWLIYAEGCKFLPPNTAWNFYFKII